MTMIVKKDKYVTSFKKSNLIVNNRKYDTTLKLTCNQLNVEYIHALVLPWWCIFATVCPGSSELDNIDAVFGHRI